MVNSRNGHRPVCYYVPGKRHGIDTPGQDRSLESGYFRSSFDTVPVLMAKNLDIDIRLASPSKAPVLSSIAISAKRSNGYSDSFMNACRDELTVTAKDMTKGEYSLIGFATLLLCPLSDDDWSFIDLSTQPPVHDC